KPKKGVSRSRIRAYRKKRKIGRRRGVGSRSGSSGARNPRKRAWIQKIRALRSELKILKAKHQISEKTYSLLYDLASSGTFSSVSDLKRYIESENLWRRR
ncbi:MAG: 50S ribosomal protein L19e, partial [Candidatus Bathyarchaeia archaeon]